jgi:hypothetical protein
LLPESSAANRVAAHGGDASVDPARSSAIQRIQSKLGERMPITVKEITRMSAQEVDQLFRIGEVGPIPDGKAEGTAIIWPGTPVEPLVERFVHGVAWQGKVVHASAGYLKNRILPIGVQAVAADVYRGRSWFDGSDCIVLDYSQRSRVARWVRDEIRRVAPGLYLGLVYLRRTRLIYFTLQFPI